MENQENKQKKSYAWVGTLVAAVALAALGAWLLSQGMSRSIDINDIYNANATAIDTIYFAFGGVSIFLSFGCIMATIILATASKRMAELKEKAEETGSTIEEYIATFGKEVKKKKVCPYCGRKLKEDEDVCPGCGAGQE